MSMLTEHLPGNSVREMGDKINGGAVSDERSPEKEAILVGSETVGARFGLRR